MSGVHLRHWPGDPKRPALALHCMLASGHYWGPIAERLSGRINLRGFDMPGQGRSDDWQPGVDDPDYHTAVTRIAASFIDRPFDLIGHSLGATVALRIAVAAPEAVRSLTLIEPVLFAASPHLSQDGTTMAFAADLGAGRTEAAARRFLSVWGDRNYDDLPSEVQKNMCRQMALVAATNGTLTQDTARILRADGLEAIAAPVLIIMGAKTVPVIHDIAAALAARLPDVGRAQVPDAGHMVPITHPDAVTGLIAVNLDRA